MKYAGCPVCRAPCHQNCKHLSYSNFTVSQFLNESNTKLLASCIYYNDILYIYMLQRNHRFCPHLTFSATAPLQLFLLSLLFIRGMQAQTLMHQAQEPWLSVFTLSYTSFPTSGTVSPRTPGTHSFSSLLPSLPSKTNSRHNFSSPLTSVTELGNTVFHPSPKGGQGCLMSPCLESQGCHLVPLSYLLSCLFVFAKSSCSFCLGHFSTNGPFS